MIFAVTVLGSSSALPTATRNPTAHLLNVNGQFFLIDCGEGTQMQLLRYHLKIQRIDTIFISHLHGDHYFGLVGLISTMELLDRQKELHIYCPQGLKPIIDLQLNEPESSLSFPVIFHELVPGQYKQIIENNNIEVFSFPLKHRIHCWGFLFREKKRLRNIRKEAVERYRIPFEQIVKIKQGEDYITSDSKLVPNSDITVDPPATRSYAFCTDTVFSDDIAEYVRGVNLLYHDATFGEDKTERAKQTFHSTASQAAQTAKIANAGQLLLGHFSARYKNLQPLLDEAKAIFSNTILAEEGKEYSVNGNQ